MVLLEPPQAGARQRARLRAEDGSQAMEFAMLLPMVVLMLLIVFAAGLVGADLVTAHGLARDAARTGAVEGVDEAREQVEEGAGARGVDVDVTPARPVEGDTLTATVRLRSPAFSALGVDVWLPARASMRVEGP